MDDFDKAGGGNGGIHNQNNNQSNDANSDSDSPSLLRVALSAGYINLAQSKSGRKSNASSPKQINDNIKTNTKYGVLPTASEDLATLSLINKAQLVASQKTNGAVIDKNNIDPLTLVALSSLGQFSHASKGVLVNIIDPSTPSGGVTYNQISPASLPPNIMHNTPPTGGKAGGLFKTLTQGTNNSTHPPTWDANAHSNLQLFSKLQTTFNRDYNSTLHSLSYSKPRTSTASNPSKGTIAHLPVRLGLTIQPISDPDRWHEEPYCHVYIAPCENIDHYRAKVRPAIRAFVSQIEGSGIGIKDDSTHGGETSGVHPPALPPSSPISMKKSGSKPTANEKALEKAGLAAEKTSAAGNFGSRYIIVFVPTGRNVTGSPGGGGFGGFRAGRKGGVITSGSVNRDDFMRHSSNSLDTNETNQDVQIAAAAAAALPPGPIAHSSKEVKDLYMKFIKDFPKGRIVIMGTLVDDADADGNNNSNIAAMSPLKNQEWKAFLHNLGGAIVDGFGDRVKRYDEELRRLDFKRAAFVRKMSGEKLPTDEEASEFDLSHFFLVKESLAFTYEQMQMPDESKLQYEELGAFLPEEAWRQLAQAASDENDINTWDDNLALANDVEEFRRYVKSSGRDLKGVSRLVSQYMYIRQMRLLFQMGAAVDVLVCSRDFLVQEYRNRLSDVASKFERKWKTELRNIGIDSSSDEVLTKQKSVQKEKFTKEAEVEAWALSSCWDIKCSAEHFFSFSFPESTKYAREASRLAAVSSASERDAARCLAELLEFATLRLTRIGDLSLGNEGRKANPIRRATERPENTKRSWEPWKQLQKGRESKQTLFDQINDNYSLRWDLDLPHNIVPWLSRAFVNRSKYEETYLELAECAVVFNRLAGRFRFASRLEDNRAEVLISRGDFESAANILANNVGACSQDQWDRAHYWRIFRLACCQRMSCDVLAYLETLIQSFNPRLASVAPPKTSALFQSDLEAIIADAVVAEPRWGAFPFIETELSIKIASKTSSMPLPFMKRKLSKHINYVGDELNVSLKITSHLPRQIMVNGIRLYLVTLEQFENVYRRDGVVSEDDAFRTLRVDAPIGIQPGETIFSFTWQPMTSNIYVLATVEIQWGKASFFYDSALLRKPIVGLDIQPSAPTQTIELNPLFLIPGDTQNVRLVLHSGSDVITGGKVKFICSKGLQVVPPNTDPSKADKAWSDECTFPLQPCIPGEKVIITTLVKSNSNYNDEDGTTQTMKALVETCYRHKSYTEAMSIGEEPDTSLMKTLLEAKITTLDRPILNVDATEHFAFGNGEVMINVSLQFNSPIPFLVKEWNLDLPPPLGISSDGDLNHGMFRHAIYEGEILSFGFKCARSSAWLDHQVQCERPILRVVLQDAFGKTFLQALPLNLESIYMQLEEEDACAKSCKATAELLCLATEGAVGHPVPFVYNIDAKSLLKSNRKKLSEIKSYMSEDGCPVMYSILSNCSDWIVSGKVQGLLNLSSEANMITLQFRGIPTQSGVLRSFPELLLEYLPLKDSYETHIDTSQITLQCKNPECFKSIAYSASTSLAVPAGNEF